MSKDTSEADDAAATRRKPKGRLGFAMMAAGVVVLLGGGGGAAWYAGLLNTPFGLAGETVAAAMTPKPVLVELPDIIANLNAGPRRQAFVRLKARIEVPRAEDAAIVREAMPRVLDLFTTYLRETRPEELRGSAGNHRLREELIARANIALRPATVSDVLFTEFVVQ
jgi:flagellar FliL protein